MNSIDAEVAEKVMGYKWWLFEFSEPEQMLIPPDDSWPSHKRWHATIIPAKRADVTDTTDLSSFRPSTRVEDAWRVVRHIQKLNPGWRFSLLGGDTQFSSNGKEVDLNSRMQFGWHAEFFGHENPALCTGQRHGTAHGETAELAICAVALNAAPLWNTSP